MKNLNDPISVLIPLRNTQPKWIHECVDSILKQTYQHFEIVIIDDLSDDDSTLATLDLLEKENPGRCKIFHSEVHNGVAGSLNLGLEKCKYNLVARMDSDDVMLPLRLERQILFMKGNPDVDILGGQIDIYNSDLSKIKHSTNHPHVVNKHTPMKTHWFLNHPTIMYKRDRILTLGGYGNLKGYAEDVDLWLRCLAAGYVIRNLPDKIVKYRSSSYQVTRSGFNANKKKWMAHILKKYRNRVKKGII